MRDTFGLYIGREHHVFEFSDTVKYQGANYLIVFRNKDWYFSFNGTIKS